MKELPPAAVGRTSDEHATIAFVMAHRPDLAELDIPLTKEDLAKRRRALAMLSVHSVRDAYREAYERCEMNGPPRAAAIQELVTVWKQLWEWRRRQWGWIRRGLDYGECILNES